MTTSDEITLTSFDEATEEVGKELSEMLGENLMTRYHDLFDPLTDEQRAILSAATNVFVGAYLAYVAANDGSSNPTNRILTAEQYAHLFAVKLKYFNEVAGENDFTAAKRLQKISDYLEDHKWAGLPSYQNLEKQVVHVTASGMINDMNCFISDGENLRKQLEAITDKGKR